MNVIDLKIFSFHELLQRKIRGEGRQKKGRPIPFPGGEGFHVRWGVQGQGQRAAPLIVCLLDVHIFFTKSGHFTLKLKSLTPSTRGLEVDAQILGVTCDVALGTGLVDAVTLRMMRLGFQGTCLPA